MARYRASIETNWTSEEVECAPRRAVTFVGENATVVSHDRITFEKIATGAAA
jgi:hypothetical protein